jgi:hypothetical protein
MFQSKCKICRSTKAEDIEFCRYFLEWPYKLIAGTFSDDIDELSNYNLSTHFNRHTDYETVKWWQELGKKVTAAELAELQRQADIRTIAKLRSEA